MSFNISLYSVSKFIILFGILIVPLLNVGEVSNLISGDLRSQTEVTTALYIKALKDLTMISIIFILLTKNLKNKIKFSYLIFVLFFIVLTTVSISITILASNQNYIIYGLRWLYPVFIFIFGISFFDERVFDKKFDIVFFIVFLMHLSMQFFQFLSGIPWFGLIGQYSSRNPGIFLLPNTGAFFSILFLFYVLFLTKSSSKLRFILTVLSIISILLTGSGTGVVVLFLIIILKLFCKRIFLFPLILLLGLPILKILSTYIRGEDYIEVSGGTRLQIFVDTFKEAGLFSPAFGYFTNLANLMKSSDIIMDSTYASILGNLGILPFSIIVTIVLFYFLKAYLALEKVKVSFLLVILLFSGTTIIFEAYPMNMLLALMGSVLYGKKYEYSLKRS